MLHHWDGGKGDRDDESEDVRRAMHTDQQRGIFVPCHERTPRCERLHHAHKLRKDDPADVRPRDDLVRGKKAGRGERKGERGARSERGGGESARTHHEEAHSPLECSGDAIASNCDRFPSLDEKVLRRGGRRLRCAKSTNRKPRTRNVRGEEDADSDAAHNRERAKEVRRVKVFELVERRIDALPDSYTAHGSSSGAPEHRDGDADA